MPLDHPSPKSFFSHIWSREFDAKASWKNSLHEPIFFFGLWSGRSFYWVFTTMLFPGLNMRKKTLGLFMVPGHACGVLQYYYWRKIFKTMGDNVAFNFLNYLKNVIWKNDIRLKPINRNSDSPQSLNFNSQTRLYQVQSLVSICGPRRWIICKFKQRQ